MKELKLLRTWSFVGDYLYEYDYTEEQLLNHFTEQSSYLDNECGLRLCV